MAHRKNLAHRLLFNLAKFTSCSSSSFINTAYKLSSPNRGEAGFICRLLTAPATERLFIYHQLPPLGDRIRLLKRSADDDNKKMMINISRENNNNNTTTMSIEEVRKVLRASQMEEVRARVRGMNKSCVSYSEFVEICAGRGGHDGRTSTTEEAALALQGREVAKLLDDSGHVIVIGDLVYLHPHQVARAIESVIPLSIPTQNDPRRKELKAMEEKKAEIDRKAKALAKRESWCGWGLLLLQQIGFMRLTFWELSWDVMEPVCFFVTSIYFMAGYAFFLRTSAEPSFEGIFQSRFVAKQKRLIRTENFDVEKFNELKRAFPSSVLSQLPSGSNTDTSVDLSCNCHHKDNTLLRY